MQNIILIESTYFYSLDFFVFCGVLFILDEYLYKECMHINNQLHIHVLKDCIKPGKKAYYTPYNDYKCM